MVNLGSNSLESKLRFDIESREGETEVLLIGSIDEDSSFEPLKSLNGKIIFNFEKVNSINSCGVRNWVNFVKGFKGADLVYKKCPVHIVRQINMVPSFLNGASVESVFVPYYCDNCDLEKFELIHSDVLREFESKVDEVKECPNCHNESLEFDGDKEQFFSFVKRHE